MDGKKMNAGTPFAKSRIEVFTTWFMIFYLVIYEPFQRFWGAIQFDIQIVGFGAEYTIRLPSTIFEVRYAQIDKDTL